MIIDGLDYYYKSEAEVEYLILHITKELSLNNWQYLIRTEHKASPDNIEELEIKKKSITVLPNSTLTFVIKRK